MSNVIKNIAIKNGSIDNMLQVYINGEQVTCIEPQTTYHCSVMEHEEVTAKFKYEIANSNLYELRIFEVD